MAKEERNGNLLERPRTRLPKEPAMFATSKEQIRNMMCEFKKATEKVGLRIHPDKTKILSNQSNMNSDTKKIY